MNRNRTAIVGALAALALAGCIGIPLHISSVEEDLPNKTAPIVVGQTDRAQVRLALGEPLIASEYWRFDAFRISDWNVGVAVFAGGIPVPFWGREDGYIFVAYGDDGRAADVQYGLKYLGTWNDLPSDRANIAVTASDLQLRATGQETFLAVPPNRWDEYLREVPAGEQCRVLIGASNSIREATLRLDEQPGPKLPEMMEDVLLLLRLAPGSHSLEVLGSGAVKAGTARIECAAGALLYAALRVVPNGGGSKHPSVEITVSSERPYGFEHQALLIWGNGQWLVPQELE